MKIIIKGVEMLLIDRTRMDDPDCVSITKGYKISFIAKCEKGILDGEIETNKRLDKMSEIETFVSDFLKT